MKCLLVEDEPQRIERILPELKKTFGETGVELATSRDAAKAQVDQCAFDLIVLDQRIPTRDGELDADVIHGRAVLDYVREVAPDTPVYFLTGLQMEDDYVDRLIEEGARADVWGSRDQVPLIRRFQKTTLDPFYKAVSAIAALARITDDIEINTKGSGVALTADESRLLKVFTRQQGGICADIAVLSGGLSGARVIRAEIKDAKGGVRLSVASKLGPFDSISDETSRYEREVVRLPADTYATMIPGQMVRVRKSKGAFYRLLDGYDTSLFKVLEASDANGAVCVKAIQGGQRPWTLDANTEKRCVRDLLKEFVHEDRLPKIHASLSGIDWQTIEGREISVTLCTRHGDLHGENVLVDAKHRAMMIDYGEVSRWPSAIDAVTLELSPYFHPRGLRKSLRWNPGDGPIDWFDRPSFLKIASCPTYINATRDWAHAESFGDREVLACAYMYTLRQLQFPDTDKDLAVALLAGIVSLAATV